MINEPMMIDEPVDQPPLADIMALCKPKRGAPLGNKNALKHGFYSRQFRKNEMRDLSLTSSDTLNDEIAMLRIAIRRMLEFGEEPANLAEALVQLRAISLASNTMTRMIRVQSTLGPDAVTEFKETVNQAIRETLAEWRAAP